MEIWPTLLEILLLLTGALVLGALAERLKQSAILGYLLAGTLLGPNALHFVTADALVETLAELGVALLLFSIGLEFSFRRLKSLGPAALLGGTLQVIITLIAAAAIAMAVGTTYKAAIALGAAIALSSTASVLRVLMARAEIESIHGRLATGILLTQDLAVVPLVVLLGVLGGEGSATEVLIDSGKKVLAAVILITGFWFLFNYFVPFVLGSSLMRRNRELPLLLAIIAGLGSAMITHSVGLSASLGAFIVGIILAESPFAVQIRADIAALRTLLLTLFFTSVGMQGDPAWAIGNMGLVAVVVVAVVVGKALIVWLVLNIVRVRHRHGMASGICLAQIGEFSFVLAGVAMTGGLIDDHLMHLLVTATIITLFATPYLVALAPVIAHHFTDLLHKYKIIRPITVDDAGDSHQTERIADHVLIVGFGPAGQAIGETLLNNPDRVHVIELNHSAITQARRLGFHAHYGDASHAEVLEHVQAHNAAAAVITIPDPNAARRIILLLRSLAPELFIIARARYHLYRWELQHAGASVVLDEEYQLGIHAAAELHYYLGTRSEPGSSAG